MGLPNIPEGDWFCSACARQRQQRARRRRPAPVEEITLDSDLDEEGTSSRGPPARRRRLVRGRELELPPRRQAANSRGNRSSDDLDGFVVDDSDDDGAEEYVPSAGQRRQRAGGRRAGRAAPRSRSRRTVASPDDSSPAGLLEDDDDEGEWSESGSEDSDVTAASPDGRSGRPSAPQRTGTGSRRSRAANGTQQGRGAGVTAAHRRVDAVQRNWAALRAGTSSFDEVLGSAEGGRARPQQQGQPRRRRLVSAGQLAAEGTTHGDSTSEVIDLTGPPQIVGQRRSMQGRQQQQQQQQEREGQESTRRLSPPLLNLSLSSKLRADLAECKDRGAQLVSRNRPGPSFSRPQQRQPFATPPARPFSGTGASTGGGSSGGRRMRTVGDLAFGASVARGTPGSNGSGPGSHWRHTGTAQHGLNRGYQGQQDHRAQNSPPLRSFAFQAVPRGQGLVPGVPAWRASGHPRNQHQQQRAVNSGGNSSPRPLRERLQERREGRNRFLPPPPPAGLTLNTSLAAESPTPEGLQRPTRFAAVIDPEPAVPAQPVFDVAGHIGPTVHGSQDSGPMHFGSQDIDADSPGGRPSGIGGNSKRHAMELVKGQLKVLFEAGELSREQYKQVAQRAVRSLHSQYGLAASGDHAAAAVDEALIAVIRGG